MICIPFFISLSASFQRLKKAVSITVDDDDFKIPSTLAEASRKSALGLLSWMEKDEHKEKVEVFADAITTELGKAFASSSKSLQTRREKMWGQYHTVRTSSKFIQLWVQFLNETSTEPLPTLYQHLTSLMFAELVKEKFPVVDTQLSECSEELTSLGYDEANAMRYVAGYVCRAVRKKITASHSPLQQELLLALWELLEDESVHCSEDEEVSLQHQQPSSCDWIGLVDRGGLVHVNTEAFMLFTAIEGVVRSHYRVDNLKAVTDGRRHELTQRICANEDVQFQWCMISVDMPEDVALMLLKLIVDMWVTIRGFSFVKCYLELYKQQQKKITQRSKGLRKELFTSKVE